MKKLPFTETIQKKRSDEEKEFLFRCGEPGDLESVLLLQEAAAATVSREGVFVKTTREDLQESLRQDICLLALCEGRAAGFSLVVAPRISERNLGRYLDYTDEQLMSCVTYDTTFVHPDFRGYGLQRRFIALRDRLARRMGAGEALMSISPDNLHSLRNATGSGFQIIDRQQMYHGVSRYILRKEFAVKRPDRLREERGVTFTRQRETLRRRLAARRAGQTR